MKYTKNRNSEVKRHLYKVALLALAAGLGFASCSQIVDSEPNDDQALKSPETNVKSFYYKIEDKGAQYRYALTSNHAYLPTSDVLVMNMQGNDGNDVWNGMPVYSCDWAYEVTSGSPPWFYAMSDTAIVALGVEYNTSYTDSWVELKAPLKKDAFWSFTSDNEQITARISQYGVTAKVGDKTFNDVLVVTYKGDKGTDGTTWFQRDTGVIYSHLVRPAHDEQIDLQFKSMKDN
jgi:hypothetical protein